MESPVSTILGRLEVRATDTGDHHDHNIHQGKEIVVGRDEKSCQIVLSDPTISNKHLKIYSVVYESDGQVPEIDPLIYAEDLSSNGSYWNGSLMGKGNGSILLSDGDELRLSPRFDLKFKASSRTTYEINNWEQYLEMQYFKNDYQVTARKLGLGAQGDVYMAINQTTGRQGACKIVDLRKIRLQLRKNALQLRDPSVCNLGEKQTTVGSNVTSRRSMLPVDRRINEYISKISREFDILKHLNHANVIRLEKVYRSENTLYIFEELITGGDLFSYVDYKGGFLREAEGGVIVRQVLEALRYLHDKEIVHRDLKPENILIASLADVARVVVTDFGSAVNCMTDKLTCHRRMETQVGTPGFVAPEVNSTNTRRLQRGYTKAVDMWSLGCVTVVLLTGVIPEIDLQSTEDKSANPQTTLQTVENEGANNLNEHIKWQSVSRRPKDFVNCLLEFDESRRMTAQQALEHEWFTNPNHKSAFDEVYRKSIAGWKPRAIVPEVVEIKIALLSKKRVLDGKFRKQKPKSYRPVEPPYHPYHKNLDAFLSSRRSVTPLPSIAEVNEETKLCLVDSASRTSISIIDKEIRTVCADRSAMVPKHGQETLPAVEKLTLSNDGQLKRIFQSTKPQGTLHPVANLSQAQVHGERLDKVDTPSDVILNGSGASYDIASDMSEQHPKSSTTSRSLKRPSFWSGSSPQTTYPNQQIAVTDSWFSTLGAGPPRPSAKRRKPRDIFEIDIEEIDTGILVDVPTVVSQEKGFEVQSEYEQVTFNNVANKKNNSVTKNASQYAFVISKDIEETISRPNMDHARKRTHSFTEGPYHNWHSSRNTKSVEKEETVLTTNPNIKRRRTTTFDFDEHDLHAETGKECGLFRTAREYGQSVEKRRVAKTSHVVPADLTDSIRTAV